ncbi:phage holin family protein [Paenibacillus sp. IB182496]|uniref:Phage holin family protein n=1 Tax=Paenibacillus sabuli TaxID=2772509 RepID=A0A927BSX0_9BACL|nr:phage holin family protein [Paenibacillus sabuli]MBD2846178.1 phage holin family protein [Paenibacillus sabuli]
MTWDQLNAFLDPQLAIVVAACWVIGSMLKQTPRVPNWSIVYLVTAAAIAFTLALTGFTALAVLQGILAGALAVFGHQLIKQARNGADHDQSMGL